jgi:hypothetical protein
VRGMGYESRLDNMIFTIYEHRYVENSWLSVPTAQSSKRRNVPGKVTLETLLGWPFDVLDPNRAEVGDATVGILLRESDRPIDTF